MTSEEEVAELRDKVLLLEAALNLYARVIRRSWAINALLDEALPLMEDHPRVGRMILSLRAIRALTQSDLTAATVFDDRYYSRRVDYSSARDALTGLVTRLHVERKPAGEEYPQPKASKLGGQSMPSDLALLLGVDGSCWKPITVHTTNRQWACVFCCRCVAPSHIADHACAPMADAVDEYRRTLQRILIEPEYK